MWLSVRVATIKQLMQVCTSRSHIHIYKCLFCLCIDFDPKSLIVQTTADPKPEHQWVIDLRKEMERLNNNTHENKEDERATVDEDCPKCGFGKASFYTMQLRSVDEGQTVFYTCLDCSHKWSQNN